MSAAFAVDLTLAALRRGEAAAPAQSQRRRFEDILSRHHARLRRAAAGVLVETGRLDDVLQEAYLKAFRALPPAFANAAHEATWLHRIVYNTCLDELRARRRRGETAELLEDVHVTRSDHEALEVTDALRALAPAEREVLVLVDLLGYDYDTAGAVLNVPRGTVASRLNKARTAFRRSLGA